MHSRALCAFILKRPHSICIVAKVCRRNAQLNHVKCFLTNARHKRRQQRRAPGDSSVNWWRVVVVLRGEQSPFKWMLV